MSRKHRKTRVNKGGRPKQHQGPLVPPEIEARRRAVAGDAWRSDAASRPLVALSEVGRITTAERRAGEELAALYVAYRRAIGGPNECRRGSPGGNGNDAKDADVVARMDAVEAALRQCTAPALARAFVWAVCIEDSPDLLDRNRWALVTPQAWQALHDGLAAVGQALGLVMRRAA